MERCRGQRALRAGARVQPGRPASRKMIRSPHALSFSQGGLGWVLDKPIAQFSLGVYRQLTLICFDKEENLD